MRRELDKKFAAKTVADPRKTSEGS